MTSTLGERIMWRDGDLRMSQCVVCRHKNRDVTCAAFPDGIPAAVLRNETSHAEPIDGDRGVRLDPIEVAADLFEQITGLPWPQHAVSHDHLDALIARRRSGGALDAELAIALLRAELLLPRGPGETPDQMSITTVNDAAGNAHVPLFTSIPRLEAFCGEGTPRIRLTLDNFPDGFGGIPVVLNPGSGNDLAFDPLHIRQLAASGSGAVTVEAGTNYHLAPADVSDATLDDLRDFLQGEPAVLKAHAAQVAFDRPGEQPHLCVAVTLSSSAHIERVCNAVVDRALQTDPGMVDVVPVVGEESNPLAAAIIRAGAPFYRRSDV